MAQVNAARKAAVDLLDGVLEDRYVLSALVSGPTFLKLAPEDRARAQRLATGVLRSMDRLDRILDPMLRKAPELRVKNILRLGTFEMVAEGEAPHGVVNDLVAICGASRHIGSMKGFVNAVLRRTAEVTDWGKMPMPRMPKWLRKPLLQAYGNGGMLAMETAHFRGAPLDITVKSDAAGWAEKLEGEVLPTGSVRLKTGRQVSALDGFDSGDWWVQDAAAALPAMLLNAQPGETVLDLCAAPGGKTMQMAAAGAQVTALDISEQRLERVTENLARTKLEATILAQDAFKHFDKYDAVLLDAPCSATGTIRRHPDLLHARDGSGISELIGLQEALLDHAISLVKPGGRIVFATCSLIPDEGEVQVEDALARNYRLSADTSVLERDGIDPAWITQEGGLRLRPDYWGELGGMDGFYMACLKVAE